MHIDLFLTIRVVHASYTDITAEDFLHVQTNTTYRKQWDKSAIALDVVDVDPKNSLKSHVIYWEMLWPVRISITFNTIQNIDYDKCIHQKLFANRDYVFQRRFVVDRARKLIVIASKSIEHPACPLLASKQRVQEYWSYMVIKPTTTFKKPGIEYVLTYFDNPGIVVPPAITSWVAQKQMPDFLNKLYMATLAYAETRPRLDNDVESVRFEYEIYTYQHKTMCDFRMYRLHFGTTYPIRALSIHRIRT